MRRNKNPALGGQRVGLRLHIGIKFAQLIQVCISIGVVGVGARRIKFNQSVAHRLGSNLPKLDVKPDMRIKLGGVLGPGDQARRVDAFGDCNHGLAFANLLEDVIHLRLKKVAVVENNVGLGQPLDIALAGDEEVRVHSGAHERLDGDGVAANVARNVGNLPGRGDDAQSVFSVRRARGSIGAATARSEHEHGRQHRAERRQAQCGESR